MSIAQVKCAEAVHTATSVELKRLKDLRSSGWNAIFICRLSVSAKAANLKLESLDSLLV